MSLIRIVFFSQERAEHMQRKGLYTPFGAGPHRCIGMNYAMILIKTVMFQLLRRYEVKIEPMYDDPFNYKPLIVPLNDLPIQLERLQAGAAKKAA